MTGESDINDGVEINNWWLECCQGVPIGPPHTISAEIAIRDKTALHIVAGNVHIVEESVNLENLEIRDEDGLRALAQASLFVVELNFPESV